MKIMTVLKCGGEYHEGHVKAIKAQLPDHEVMCLTDSKMPEYEFKQHTGCQKIDMIYNAWGGRGWWAKMEMFAPAMQGDFLYVDLDTVFVKQPEIFEGMTEACVLSDFYFPETSIGSGLMFLPQHCRGAIWDRWIKDPIGHIGRNHGDQDFLTPWLWRADRFQDKFPYAVVSYKAHLNPEWGRQFYKKGFDNMEKIHVVCFHGNPRPWQVKHEWIPNGLY